MTEHKFRSFRRSGAKLEWHELLSILVVNKDIDEISLSFDRKNECYLVLLALNNATIVKGQGNIIKTALEEAWNKFQSGENDDYEAFLGEAEN